MDHSRISDEQKSNDSRKREKYEKEIRQKLDELHAVKERLYQLRHDYSRPNDDIVQDVRNLAQEYNRIEEDIIQLRKKELADFERSLNLKALNLDPILSKGFKRNMERSNSLASASSSHLGSSSSSFPESSSTTTAPVVSPSLEVQPIEEHETMSFIPENEKLMRTKSTQSIKNLPPQEKWGALFKMFKEWNHQTTVAQASQLVGKGEAHESVHEEIIKLRSALYSMRQRKNQSESDKRLMEQLANKLKGLTKIAADMEQIKQL